MLFNRSNFISTQVFIKNTEPERPPNAGEVGGLQVTGSGLCVPAVETIDPRAVKPPAVLIPRVQPAGRFRR